MLRALHSSHSHYLCMVMGVVLLCMCGVCAHMYADAYKGLQSRSHVFTQWFSAYALRKGLTESEAHQFGSPAGRFQGFPNLQHPLQPKVGLLAYTASLAFVYMGSGDFNLGVLMLATGSSPAEPSHWPQYKAFYHVSESSIINILLYFYVPF